MRIDQTRKDLAVDVVSLGTCTHPATRIVFAEEVFPVNGIVSVKAPVRSDSLFAC